MNLNDLFKPQAELDKHIINEHDLHNQDLLQRRSAALICEVWECLNETKLFKFWSKKKAIRSKVLEEYVDSVHFALSLGNQLGYTKHVYEEVKDKDIIDLAFGITNLATLIPVTKDKNFSELFNLLIKLGYQLGFTEQEVIEAYYAKNKINHERQANGY